MSLNSSHVASFARGDEHRFASDLGAFVDKCKLRTTIVKCELRVLCATQDGNKPHYFVFCFKLLIKHIQLMSGLLCMFKDVEKNPHKIMRFSPKSKLHENCTKDYKLLILAYV